VKCVVPQIYKAIKLALYNVINRNGRLWLSTRHHWFSYIAQQRTLCRVKYLADSSCRYGESWREYALSGMPWPLVTYSMMMEGVRFESNSSTLHYCKISARFHSLTEMSRDRNSSDWNSPDRNSSDRNGPDRKVLFRSKIVCGRWLKTEAQP